MSLVIQKPTGGKLVLKSYGTPAGIAGVAPTLDYRFALDRNEIDAVSLTDKLIFSRSAVCSFRNSAGNIALAGANVARFDHSLEAQSLGLLFEVSRTNAINNSSNLDSFFSAKVNLTMPLAASPAPDGTFTAYLALPTTSSAKHAFGPPLNTTGATSQTCINSIFAKSSGYSYCVLSDNTTGGAVFDLSTGSNVSVDSGITALPSVNCGGGWWRLAISYVNTTNRALGFDVRNNSNQGTFAGDGVSGILVWGPQVEINASNLTSYIPTSTGTVTRTETATVTLAAGTKTLVEKPAGSATLTNDTTLTLNPGYTIERVMVFPAALSSDQITAIRGVM